MDLELFSSQEGPKKTVDMRREIAMIVYVAGPYSGGDIAVNTRNAILAGEEVVKKGHIPFIPHLTHLWHMVCPHEENFWYDYDLVWLAKCDAILRLPGFSKGADREMAMAKQWGIPEFKL
jgi:hypothetical protein